MSTNDAFTSMFDRIPDLVRAAVADLSAEELAQRPASEANTIAWLVWHLARVEDDHVSKAAQALEDDRYAAYVDQAYPAFADRFDLPFGVEAIGYGQSAAEVGEVHADAQLLVDYYDAVHEKTAGFLTAVPDEDWTRVVDEGWDPPVRLVDRITSVVGDVVQHVGQAAYARGIIERESRAQ